MTPRRILSGFLENRCQLLGLKCSCPHLIVSTTGVQVEFAAFFPQFGSPKGILIDVITEPTYAPSEIHKLLAAAHGIPITFVNPQSMVDDATELISALRDWGYFGQPGELREDVRALLLS